MGELPIEEAMENVEHFLTLVYKDIEDNCVPCAEYHAGLVKDYLDTVLEYFKEDSAQDTVH